MELVDNPHSSHSVAMKLIKSVIFKDIVVLTEDACVSPGEIKDVQVPDSVPVDLRAKLIVCLIHMHVSAPLEVNGTNKASVATLIWCITVKFYS